MLLLMTPHEPISSCTFYLDIARKTSHDNYLIIAKKIFKSCNEKMFYKVTHVLLSAYLSDLSVMFVQCMYGWQGWCACINQHAACCSPYVPQGLMKCSDSERQHEITDILSKDNKNNMISYISLIFCQV